MVTETLESPLYQTKIQELLLKAAEEQSGGGERKNRCLLEEKRALPIRRALLSIKLWQL